MVNSMPQIKIFQENGKTLYQVTTSLLTFICHSFEEALQLFHFLIMLWQLEIEQKFSEDNHRELLEAIHEDMKEFWKFYNEAIIKVLDESYNYTWLDFISEMQTKLCSSDSPTM